MASAQQLLLLAQQLAAQRHGVTAALPSPAPPLQSPQVLLAAQQNALLHGLAAPPAAPPAPPLAAPTVVPPALQPLPPLPPLQPLGAPAPAASLGPLPGPLPTPLPPPAPGLNGLGGVGGLAGVAAAPQLGGLMGALAAPGLQAGTPLTAETLAQLTAAGLVSPDVAKAAIAAAAQATQAAAMVNAVKQATTSAALASLQAVAAAQQQSSAAMQGSGGGLIIGGSPASSSTSGGPKAEEKAKASALAGSAGKAAGSSETAASQASAIPEVPKCHLHKKANKACKFCKAHASYLEQKSKEDEERAKTAAKEKARESAMGPQRALEDKVPQPNLASFPSVLREKLLGYRYFNQVISVADLTELKEILKDADTCELESRGQQGNLDLMPTVFLCCVYRLLTLKLTEGQLLQLLNNRSLYVRCATYLYIRLGVHQDRYWEHLSEHLLDDEEFTPFPFREGLTMSEGQYVEHLLSKEKYCDVALPRIAPALKRTLHERLVYYDQFRRRYVANLEVADRFDGTNGGVHVEVCTYEGEWLEAETVGPRTPGRRRVTVPVRLPTGDRDVSLGMVICPPKDGKPPSSSDLTRSRGKDNKELLEVYRSSQRDAAVASGKDYCKTSGRHTVHAGGVTFVAGDSNKRKGVESDSEEERAAKKREKEPSMEHQKKMAAIMEKYCRGSTASGSAGGLSGDQNAPSRLRLG
eukprot:TRINITY_DN93885_c0_g1_i1.p1 TRINITY_DN93885_c0_g1~~TRINITY_DN93885_c0_g1_i1.p1  ORF type:complete len:696 (+),score=215.32 TRINITY_DN93885_c0_g1_i1:124-2211(+)